MTPGQIVLAIIIALLPVVAAGLLSLGVVKGKMYNYMTFEQHRDICGEQRDEMGDKFNSERLATNRDIDRLSGSLDETLKMVSQIHGYLKAQNGGQL